MDLVAPVRPISASQHSGIDKTLRDSVVFEREQCRDATELFDGGRIIDEFVEAVMTSIRQATNESALQHGIFNAMCLLDEKENVIIVPPEAKKPPKEKDMNFLNKLELFFFNPLVDQEKDMKNILDLYAEKYFTEMGLVEPKDVQKMQAAEPGPFVRASSRPDISVIVKSSDKDGDIALGEVKNDDNYTVESALMQEGAYLMLLLYWWKVFAGREVTSVFGFVVCGPRCSDLKQRKRDWFGKLRSDEKKYCICLLRLSAPQYLGGIPRLSYFPMIDSTNDNSAVGILCQFLTADGVWTKRNAPRIENPCPAWFTAPQGFSNKVKHGQSKWRLQHNGTSALVFRCVGRDGVTDVLRLAEQSIIEDCNQLWKTYLESQSQENADGVYYVKITTAATARSSSCCIPGLQQRAETLNDTDFLKTYPVKAVMSEHCCCYLMADRGRPIDKTTKWEWDEYSSMFKQLWVETVALSRAYHHGDIAKHNVLIGNGRLVLIDWDEARSHPKLRDSRGNKYLHVLHPDGLRGSPMLYTLVQLALLFWRLKIEHVDEKDEGKTDLVDQMADVPGFKAYAAAVDVEVDQLRALKEHANAFVSQAKAKLGLQAYAPL